MRGFEGIIQCILLEWLTGRRSANVVDRETMNKELFHCCLNKPIKTAP